MALLHGARQLLGKMAAATAAKPQRGMEPAADVELLKPVGPLQMTRLSAAFAPFVISVPQACLDTPSMMSLSERQFLFGLASRYYAGQGLIVDAGIFLGGSTHCFGEGVRSNPRREEIVGHWPRPIVSYERAIVNPNMPHFFRTRGLAFSAAPGESFESELRRNIEPVEDLVDLRIGDFMEAGGVDAPVEILFLDILKTPALSLRAFRQFYSRLIPERSLVVHQDYFFEELPWIKTHQEALMDYFDFVGEIGSSALFLCRREIPQAVLDGLENDMPPAEQLRLASIALHRSADPARRFFMALSKMRLVRKLQGRVAARAYLELVKTEFPEQVAQIGNKRLNHALQRADAFLVKKPKKAPRDGMRVPEQRVPPPQQEGVHEQASHRR
ncbi:MAG: hypothetical protein KA171_15150 [Reyranella sp.]|nr:hypothetical protein [Reyranella sp.]